MKVRRLLKGFRYGEKGFTLIELLVVVMILGILAAIVIPNVASFMGEGEAEAKQTEYHNIQTAVLALMVGNDATTLTGTNGGAAVNTETDCEAVTAGSDDLTDWIIGGEYPLKQSYLIATNGEVTLAPVP